uniref:Transthyretin-like family protein n=1 Tax=Panagrolaimus sp. ES5 TaxID=591445 RepID=A0AC34G6M2_9BILA
MRGLICLLIAAIIALSFAKEQTVKVRGQVICDKRSIRNALVELREHDTLDPDDTLSSIHTDKDGNFALTGTEDEITSIKPYIRITHTCDVQDRATCHRVSDFEIPADKINNGEYDMNFVNLNLKGHSDKEVCN